MCGILAIYCHHRIDDRLEQAAVKMLASLQYRGPDKAQLMKINDRMLLGHTRLRVASLSEEADQPISHAAQDIHISFNGEIFNHAALIKRLRGQGMSTPEWSEAATILALYQQYGEASFALLEGQFAFILYDGKGDKTFLVRDPFGICPLYYMSHRGVHYISSSVRAIIKALPEESFTPNMQAVEQYLMLRFVLAPHSIIKQIQQLCPGEVVTLDRQHRHTRRYWTIEGNLTPTKQSEEETIAEIAHQIQQNIQHNCQAEADVGLFLSGGLDSTIILSQARKWRSNLPLLTLDMGAEEESQAAQRAALHYGCDLTQVSLRQTAPEDLLRNMIQAMDHPIGARDSLATFALARELKHRYPAVKAVLTGAGADELFSGYRSSYFAPVQGRNLRHMVAKLLFNYCNINKTSPYQATDLAAVPCNKERVEHRIYRTLQNYCPGAEEMTADAVQNLFYVATHLPGWELATNDMMCMAQGVEPRVPYLSKSLVCRAFSLSDELRYRKGVEKYILRRGFADHLPSEIVKRRKLPLSQPLVQWIKGSGLMQCLGHFSFRDRGLLNLDVIAQLDPNRDFDLLWRVYILENWFQDCLD